MPMKSQIKDLKEILNSPKKIVITTHKGADGDAIGSSLAIYHLLKELGHQAHVITPDDYAYFLKWLPGTKNVIAYDDNKEKAEEITKESDLIFMMDLNQANRLSNYANIVTSSNSKKILIDHHEDPDLNIADIIFSDKKSSSTAELVFEIIEKIGEKGLLNKNIAECLYVGIMTDTGSFKYPSTTSRTHDIISALIQLGAENAKIHDLIYDNTSPTRIALLGYSLNKKLLLYPENNAAIISLNAKELKEFNFQKGDTEGFVNYCLSIKNIKFAAFITEKEGIVKLSLRSKGNIKVNEIAKKYFNGGGHINAAGGISKVSVNETIKELENIINNLK